MSTKTLYLALVAAVAAAPAANAMQVAVPHLAPGVTTGESGMQRMSDAARDQILSSPNIHLAATKGSFVQESGPSFVRWAGQMMLPRR